VQIPGDHAQQQLPEDFPRRLGERHRAYGVTATALCILRREPSFSA
jgi:hypothetical protein